jgi:hypothetical protein
MKKIISAMVLLVFCFSMLVSCESIKNSIINSEYERYTNKIEDFNTPEYPIDEFIVFSCGIPKNAQPITYIYNEDYEDLEVCLEMKFNSAAEIDAYINCIEKKFLDVKEDSPILQRHGWAIEDINPYNKDYIDLFLVASSSRYP